MTLVVTTSSSCARRPQHEEEDNNNEHEHNSADEDDNRREEERSSATATATAAVVRFRITGSAAHQRLVPLLPSDWIDSEEQLQQQLVVAGSVASSEQTGGISGSVAGVDFLWENAPRRDTRPYRNSVSCYSHLPNGRILDCKWALARLLLFENDNNDTANAVNASASGIGVLETHCFRGQSGLQSLLRDNKLWLEEENGTDVMCMGGPANSDDDDDDFDGDDLLFYDLLATSEENEAALKNASFSKKKNPNLWVIKDASSNGAGGIWVADKPKAIELATSPLPLCQEHRYVAQQYAWPLVLYKSRKCHVRVYALFTSDGRAFVHERCFLHVANDNFICTSSNSSSNNNNKNALSETVHITNCCANSHDGSKFAGEICAHLNQTEFTVSSSSSSSSSADPLVVPLARFANSIYATVAALAHRSFPFLQGGQANGGFEYLGLDFILSHTTTTDTDTNIPVAYLLEVNAPPSQDTATGLRHAEAVHNAVLQDLLSLWVLPRVGGIGKKEHAGGWKCVYQQQQAQEEKNNLWRMVPSKAAILNKMRWALFEQKAMRRCCDGENQNHDNVVALNLVRGAVRTLFPYYFQNQSSSSTADNNNNSKLIFFENAGGSQVPASVIRGVDASLRQRYRSVAGAKIKDEAKQTLRALLFGRGTSSCKNDDDTTTDIYLGANATTLLALLAAAYVRCGLLQATDEIIISMENHLANVTPWLDAAKSVGATIKWWRHNNSDGGDEAQLEALLTDRTRIVAVPHASNVMGVVRDVQQICQTVRRVTHSRADVVVDGVAAAPHVFAAVDDLGTNCWYAVSCHKLFGPHLGVLCGKKKNVDSSIVDHDSSLCLQLELGTVNYEACAGIVGLGQYFAHISTLATGDDAAGEEPKSSVDDCRDDSQKLNRAVLLPSLNKGTVEAAYKVIRTVEVPLFNLLRNAVAKSKRVRILEVQSGDGNIAKRLPLVSFVHNDLSCATIVAACVKAGIACRSGTFLSCSQFQEEYDIDPTEGFVRFSLAHYNTPAEVKLLERVLGSIPGWF